VDDTTYYWGGLRSVNEQVFGGKAHSPPPWGGVAAASRNFGEAHL